jgi:hypothetical protein
MKLVDPVVHATQVSNHLAPRLDTLDGKTVGLWSNQKLNANELLTCVEAELRSRHRIAGTVWGTYHPARVMRPVEWGDVDRCDAVILTHGD